MAEEILKTIIDHIGIFEKCFPGNDCPLCGKDSRLLSTTNEWTFHCVPCDIRFNVENEILTTGNVWRDVEIAAKGFVVRN